jgi:hypothetical protein
MVTAAPSATDVIEVPTLITDKFVRVDASPSTRAHLRQRCKRDGAGHRGDNSGGRRPARRRRRVGRLANLASTVHKRSHSNNANAIVVIRQCAFVAVREFIQKSRRSLRGIAIEIAIRVVTSHTNRRMIEGRCGYGRRRPSSRVRPMHRAWAWILVALAAAPFTSPFSTCDVRALVKAGAAVSLHRVAPLSAGPILVAASDTDNAPLSLEEETFKDEVIVDDVDLVIDLRAERLASTPVHAPASAFRTPLVALRL